jgi:sarcosine oxidase subunit beta
MDVIVLGGGLMGTAAAYFLARRGLRTTLIERHRVGTGATVASFGNIRRTARHLSQLPLAHRSLALWRQAETLLGRDVEFRATGHVRFVFDDDSLDDMRAYIVGARPWGLDLDELGANEIRARFPGLAPGAVAASFSPQDGSGNPRLIAPAFADAARRLGARVVEECVVGEIARTGYGFRVETSKGVFEAERLLNAAGAWGARVAARFGEAVPLTARGPQMGVTEPLPHRILPVVGVWTRRAEENGYLRQVERGNIVFGGAAERTQADLDSGHARPDPARLPGQLKALVRLAPALAKVAVIRTWSGCEGYLADMLPVMGRSETTPGLFHAFGFSGHGFQLGPGVGDVMAELIATGETQTPLDDFRIDRFARATGK